MTRPGWTYDPPLQTPPPPPDEGGPYVPSTAEPDRARIFPEADPTPPVDPEVARLAEMVSVMERMQPYERNRALRYLTDRYA